MRRFPVHEIFHRPQGGDSVWIVKLAGTNRHIRVEVLNVVDERGRFQFFEHPRRQAAEKEPLGQSTTSQARRDSAPVTVANAL